MAHDGRSRPDEPFRGPAEGAPDATASAAASGPLRAAARKHGSDADPSLPHEAEEPTRPDAESPAQDAGAPAQRSAEETDQASAVGPEQGDSGSSGAAADGDAERQLQADLEELAAKAEKADEYLALAQRTQADFENYRKRATREAALAQQRGVGRLARELLPAIDNLERAVQAAVASATPAEAAGSAEDPAAAADVPQTAAQERPAVDSPLLDGLRLVHAEVLAALARAGIEQFTPLGEAFDPQHHEAVAQHPVQDAAPGSVVEVYQPGYRLGETVLRPARVLVAA